MSHLPIGSPFLLAAGEGRLLLPGVIGGFNPVAIAATVNGLTCLPFWVARPITVTALFLETTVAAAAGGLARLGLYGAAGSSLRPTPLLAQTAEFATDGATGQLGGALAATIRLQPGAIYYAASFIGVAAPTARSNNNLATIPPLLGVTDGSAWTVAAAYWLTTSVVYAGVVPDPGPASLTPSGGAFPLIGVRYA